MRAKKWKRIRFGVKMAKRVEQEPFGSLIIELVLRGMENSGMVKTVTESYRQYLQKRGKLR